MRLLRAVARRAASRRPAPRYSALLRLTDPDGAVSYAEPNDSEDATAVAARHPGAVADVVLVERPQHDRREGSPSRLQRLLASARVEPGDMHEATTFGSECMRGLASARAVSIALVGHPLGHRVLIETTTDGYLVIGRAERVVESLGVHFFVVDRRLQERRFDASAADAATDTAAYLGDMLNMVELLNEHQTQQADEALENVIEGEVRAEIAHERARCADELVTTLRDVAQRFGTTD
jgi:hypothetical protein